MSERKGLLRILCLHGYRQSGEMFKSKMGGFRKKLKKYVELEFITAPHRIPTPPGQEEPPEPQYGWWFTTEDLTFTSRVPSDVSVGLEETWDTLRRAFIEQGPFHGVLGFSQGASLAVMLASRARTDPVFQFSFAILASGFKSPCKSHQHFYEPPRLTMPSLHVFGTTDQLVHPDICKSLADCFESPTLLVHDGGHYMPATSIQRPIYQAFLEEQASRLSLCDK